MMGMEGIKFRRIEWLDYDFLKIENEKKPGVFLLSNDGEVPLKIGRADDDLYETLKKITTTVRGFDSPFAYFWAKTTETAYEAFLLECELWHRLNCNGQPHPIPKEPDWRCPLCDKD